MMNEFLYLAALNVAQAPSPAKWALARLQRALQARAPALQLLYIMGRI